MTPSSIILSAVADCHKDIPGAGEVMVGTKIALDGRYDPGFTLIELTEIISSEPSRGAEGRVGRNPASGIQTHDALVTSLISVLSRDAASDEAFRENIVNEVAKKFAQNEQLRGISHRFWVSRIRFFPLSNNGQLEIQALCEFRIIYRAYAKEPGIAIQTR